MFAGMHNIPESYDITLPIATIFLQPISPLYVYPCVRLSLPVYLIGIVAIRGGYKLPWAHVSGERQCLHVCLNHTRRTNYFSLPVTQLPACLTDCCIYPPAPSPRTARQLTGNGRINTDEVILVILVLKLVYGKISAPRSQ